MKASAYSMGTFNRMRPPHSVASHEKTLIPVGTAMAKLVKPKKASAMSPKPTVNMWCAQTLTDRNAMAMPEATMTPYPKMGLRAKTGTTSEMIPEVVPVFARKPIFGYGVIVASGIAIAFLSVSVWAHHMFTVGLGDIADAFFGLTSFAIAVPTGIKVFSWLATLWGGRIRLNVPMLYALAFIGQFTDGGLSGVHFATVPVDWQTHDTYYVVAHFHYVLGGGSLFAILAGAYYNFPKTTGRLLDERLGKWTFWLMVVGFNLTFFPM